MNCVLIEKWNKIVGKDDLVYHLGDFCFKGKSTADIFLDKLNGEIILIKGNHDRGVTLDIFKKRFGEYHVKTVDSIKIGKYNCGINHRPVYPPGTPDPFNDHQDPTWTNGKKFSEEFDYFLTGHIHEKRLWTGKSLNVGVDVHGFNPISVDRILELIEEKKISYIQ
jgi:calcineurin-like phosphoesterase family protein